MTCLKTAMVGVVFVLGSGPLLVSLGRANWKVVHLVNTELRTKPLMFKVKEPSRTVLLQFRSNRQSGSKSRDSPILRYKWKKQSWKILVLKSFHTADTQTIEKISSLMPARLYSTGLDLSVHSLLTKVMVRRQTLRVVYIVASSDL